MASSNGAIEAIRGVAQPLTGGPHDYDALLQRIGEARFVLIGEATHGTREFYRQRALLTQRLVREHGFHAVAVEADWPDAYRVNLHVTGRGSDSSPEDALAGFERFPTWMWRNTEVVEFIDWLAAHNRRNAAGVGFFGLDLYSLYGSIAELLRTLERIDPEAAARAKQRYGCFDHFDGDSEKYAYAAALGLSASCEEEALHQLADVRARMSEWQRRDGAALQDDIFFVEQNARLVKNAEEYYRHMFRGRVNTWNLRDRHMADTLDALAAHYDERVRRSKIVVWEHNSHIGDARWTSLHQAGEWSLGQLVRERHAEDAVLVGFTTYEGSVTAASSWDGPAERKRVRPALAGSHEALFHAAALPGFLLLSAHVLPASLLAPRLERAIGVVYQPSTERVSHYFEAELFRQFDAVIHLDETHALEPLERTTSWTAGDAPETYPFAV
jgi:erythromycin esterase-like protein